MPRGDGLQGSKMQSDEQTSPGFQEYMEDWILTVVPMYFVQITTHSCIPVQPLVRVVFCFNSQTMLCVARRFLEVM